MAKGRTLSRFWLSAQEEVKDTARLVKEGGTAEYVTKRLAEADSHLATAVETLLRGLASTDVAVVQLGSILVVKKRDGDGSSIFARESDPISLDTELA